MNVGLIEGGSGVNAIAQAARCKVDIRSENNARMDQLVDILGSAVERARDLENQRQTGGRVTAKTREIGSRPAAVLPDDAPILQYVRAVDAHLGIRSYLDCSSTDANLPLSMGIPAIAIGAGGLGGGAHTSRRVVQSRRAGSGAETNSADATDADAPHGGGHGRVNRRKAELALLVNTVIWGTTFVLVKVRSAADLAGSVPGHAIFAGGGGAGAAVRLSRKWRLRPPRVTAKTAGGRAP